MPASRRDVYYWDSSVFIAWLQDEKRKPGEMEGVQALATRFESKEIILATSVLTEAEVLETRLTAKAQKMFEDFFKRPNVVQITFDSRVAKLTRLIRGHYDTKGKKLSVPDCTHLASAIHVDVKEMHTFDEDDLLPLNGNVAGFRLIIVKPNAPQLEFQGEGFT